jgi:uncharacterized protein (TIRG00374 family)
MNGRTATVARGRVNPAQGYKRFVYLVICVVAIYIVVPQLSMFRQSFGLIGHARLDYVALALGLNLASYPLAALTYYLLAIKPIHFQPTVLVQVASMFTNRLLPAGLGGMGANFVYLRRTGHKASQAVSVVGLNNVLGLVGHLMLLSGLLLLVPDDRRRVPDQHITTTVLLAGTAVTVGLVVGLLLMTKLRHRLASGGLAVIRNLQNYRRRPGRLVAAVGSSMTLTICNLVCLWCCALAVDVHISVIALLVVFTFGIALGSATPSPGGIGGVEAGLVTGLIAYGVPASQALAAVLIFRLINYWFSLLLGAGAFVAAQRRGWL